MGLGAPLLLTLLHLLFLRAAGGMLTLYTAPETRAVLGSVALLKCRFNVGRPIDPTVLRVRWLSAAAGPVAQYDQGRGTFEPRLRLSEQELWIGNASLEVQDVTVQDTGNYTCEVVYGTETQLGMTTLWVLAAPRISLDQHTGDTEMSLLCHMGRFFPKDVDVAWLRDEQVLDGSTLSSPQRNPDGTFSLTLTYTFAPVQSDTGAVFACRVRHPALEQPLHEEFTLDVPGSDRTGAAIGAVVAIVIILGAAGAAVYCWQQTRGRKAPWSMSKVEGPERCRLGQAVTLSCSVEGKIPADTAVTWERMQGEDTALIQEDGPGAAPEHQPLLPALPPGWTSIQERSETSLTASLTFTPTVQDHGARVRCHFRREAQDSSQEPACWEIRVWAPPELSRIQALKGWDPPEQVPFAVRLLRFYPRGIHRVAWSVDGKAWERSEPSDYVEDGDGTFSATSVWRVPSRSLTRPGQRVRVSVEHGPGDPPVEGELSIGDTGLLRPPEVSAISQPQSATVGRDVALSCRIAGHFPGELQVTWLRKGRGAARAEPLQDSAQYRLLPGRPDPAADGKSFQQEPSLVLTAAEKELGAEFICRVEHVALQTPIERRSAELQLTGHQETATSQKPESEEGKADEGSLGAVSITDDGRKEGMSAQDQRPGASSSGDKGAGGGTTQDPDTEKDVAQESEAEETAKDQRGGNSGDMSMQTSGAGPTSTDEQQDRASTGPTGDPLQDGEDSPGPAREGTVEDETQGAQQGHSDGGVGGAGDMETQDPGQAAAGNGSCEQGGLN